MDDQAKRVVELGYQYANEAIDYLKGAITESDRKPLDMAVFTGSAAAALLATAYMNVFKIKGDAKEARDWLSAVLIGAATHISQDSGYEVKILLVEKEGD